MIAHMGVSSREGVKSHSSALRSCYAKNDCKERVACLMPIIAEIHADAPKDRHQH